MRRTQARATLLKVLALCLTVSLQGWCQTQPTKPPASTAKPSGGAASQPKTAAQTNPSSQSASKLGVASAAKPAAGTPAAAKGGNAQASKPVAKAEPASASKTAAAQAAKPAAKSAKAATAAPAKQAAKPKVATKAAPVAKKPAAAPAAEASKEEEGPGPEKIEMANKRDPFVPLINQQKAGPSNLPPGKAGLVIGTVRVDGTVRGQQGEMIAVVTNPDQRVYFIRQGDRLYDGNVEKIDMEGVTFRVSTKDAFGKPIERVVTKKVYAMAGEQQ